MTHVYLVTILFVAGIVAGIAFWKHRSALKAKVDAEAKALIQSASKKL